MGRAPFIGVAWRRAAPSRSSLSGQCTPPNRSQESNLQSPGQNGTKYSLCPGYLGEDLSGNSGGVDPVHSVSEVAHAHVLTQMSRKVPADPKADYGFWRGLSVAVGVVNVLWAQQVWRFPVVTGPPIFEFLNVFYFAYCAGRLLVEPEDSWGSGTGLVMASIAAFVVAISDPRTGLNLMYAAISSTGIAVSLWRHGRKPN